MATSNGFLYSGASATALAEILPTAGEKYLRALKDRSVLENHPALVYAGSVANMGSSTIQLASLGIDGFDDMANSGEDSTTANTAPTVSAVTIAPAQKALSYSVSELLIGTGGDLGMFSSQPVLVNNAIVTREVKLRDMVASLMGGFSNVVGTSGVSVSIDAFIDAKSKLQQEGAPGPFLAIWHPVSWKQISKDLLALPALRAGQEVFDLAPRTGYQGNFGGVDHFVTNSVPNDGTDYLNGIFGHGAIAWVDMDCPDSQSTLANLGKVQIKWQDDLAAAMTKYVISCYLGVSEIQDKAGVTIKAGMLA